jgi:hypothetical protein
MPEESNEEVKKELLTESKRFGIFVVTAGVVVVLNLVAPFIPVVDAIPKESIQEFSRELVALAITLIAARTIRNTVQTK